MQLFIIFLLRLFTILQLTINHSPRIALHPQQAFSKPSVIVHAALEIIPINRPQILLSSHIIPPSARNRWVQHTTSPSMLSLVVEHPVFVSPLWPSSTDLRSMAIYFGSRISSRPEYGSIRYGGLSPFRTIWFMSQSLLTKISSTYCTVSTTPRATCSNKFSHIRDVANSMRNLSEQWNTRYRSHKSKTLIDQIWRWDLASPGIIITQARDFHFLCKRHAND